MPKFDIEVLVYLERIEAESQGHANNKITEHFHELFPRHGHLIQRIHEVGKAEQAIKDAAKNNPRFIDKETEEAY